ncbi:MAG: DUF4446 family protein [Tissierellia bacterium]|nr:DUF4446 family protein [Tissierellia bacterium]MDD4725669.1 DUF4446 family protein [Tissierellia bacterium]
MELIRSYISIYYIEIIIALIVVFFLLFISTIVSLIKTRKLREKYIALVRGIEGINIEDLLIKSDRDIRDIQRDLELFQQNLNTMETKLTFAIQKIGFIRYNAYYNMGSELSFSIALLDNFQNGFVFTSIYGREQSVCYAKPVKDGESNIPLSAEEIIAIERALKGENIEFSKQRRVKA